MEIVILRLWVGGNNLGHVELQAVNHGAGVGIGLASLRYCAVCNDDRLSFSDVERDERRASLGIALGCRSKLHACSHHVVVNPYFDVGLCLVLVGIIVICFQRMCTSRHASYGQNQRGRAFGNLRHVAVLQIGGQHLIGNDAQTFGLYVSLAPVAAHS